MFRRFLSRFKADPHRLNRDETRRQLAAAKAKLNKLQANYDAGTISGHPEETLELIEYADREVRWLQKAVDGDRIVDHEAIDQIEQAIAELNDRWRSVPLSANHDQYWEELEKLLADLKVLQAGAIANGVTP